MLVNNIQDALHACFTLCSNDKIVFDSTVVGSVELRVVENGNVFFMEFCDLSCSNHDMFVTHFQEQYGLVQYGDQVAFVELINSFPGWHHSALHMIVSDLYLLRACKVCCKPFRPIQTIESCDACQSLLKRFARGRIARALDRALSDPQYSLCRKRLIREFHDLSKTI